MIALRDFTGMLLAKEMRVATTFFSQGIALSWGTGVLAALSAIGFGIAVDHVCDRR